MKICCVGGGPAGLYFSLLYKALRPDAEITIYERNAEGVTFGWGVVFSDETLSYLEENDLETHGAITAAFAHWDAIDIHYEGVVVRSGGHGFSGIARRKLLQILQDRCRQLGVQVVFGREAEDIDALAASHDLVIACDGVNSKVRDRYATTFQPSIEMRASRFIWLGTRKLFDAFTFYFEKTEHGIFQVHAYRFDVDTSTFIVECDEATYQKAGLAEMSSDESTAFVEKVFAAHLDGEKLLANKAEWRRFPIVKNACWHHENIVLMGDAVHTAHFSIGSGTKLAMEDAIALVASLRKEPDLEKALVAYEEERRPIVDRIQKAAQDSLLWFENTKRYAHLEPVQFAFSLLTRSKRITFDNLDLRDHAFAETVRRWFVKTTSSARADARPMFTPFRLRGMELENRVVVSPMCMYSAHEGIPNDFHFTHYTARAHGGAGLVMTEMTNISRDARITPGCTGMYTPEHLAAWARIVSYVHEHTRAKIGMQLGHAGRKGSTKLMWDGIDRPLESGNWPIVAPSSLPYYPDSQVPRALDDGDRAAIVADYVRATRMADEAGFDLLELHMAHGYLLATFLSPLTNQRTDRYGGSRENRMRFPLEVFDAIREAWPAQKPMSVRISCTDWIPGGVDEDDVVALARALKEHGVDIIDCSAGQTTPTSRPPFYGRMYQAYWSDMVRNEVGIPTIAVGNISNADQIDTLVASGRADLCALARPHLADPHFTLNAAIARGWDGIEVAKPYGVVRPVRPRG